MKKIPVLIGAVVVLAAIGGMWSFRAGMDGQTSRTISPIAQFLEKPLEKYAIPRLALRPFEGNQIVLDEIVATESSYLVQKFHYLTDGKKVTGLAHIPHSATAAHPAPVIIQIRGYVEHDMYEPGVGTKRSAEVLAGGGFISLAPDYLGYGGSDNPSEDVFEERFQAYTATLDLLASIPSLDVADKGKVGIWAHSNGGQIALTVLEATGKTYPTTLWAPVTKPFPYSILYYTDEAPDYGKALRKKLADFEDDYNVDEYAMVNFVDRIEAPMQLHQGTSDPAVPVVWNDQFVAMLKEKEKGIEYFVYPGTDHNLQPAWNTVITRDIEFFRKHL